MVDDDGKLNPSSFIPFCGFGNKKFFNNETDYNEQLGLPVCDKFIPTVLDGRLCYKLDMDRLGEELAMQSGTKIHEINFLMDYNEDRMARDISMDDKEEDIEAMIYIETLGNMENFSLEQV